MAASKLTGTLAVGSGGTGATSFTSGDVLIGAGTGAITTLSRSGIDSRTAFPTTYANITGTIPTWNQDTTGTAAGVVKTVAGTTTAELVRGNMADNDQFRILVGGTASNAGYAEIATADDGNEPIYVRQYTGVFGTQARSATLLDESGNTSFPGTITGTRLISNIATGTAPLGITSTTKVDNLNADYLDGYHISTTATANTVVVRDANNYIYANYINSNRGNETSTAASYIYDSGDG